MDLKVITLSSNASSNLYPENNPGHFVVQLPGNGLDLEDDGGHYAWYVAMARLTFPKTWNTNTENVENFRDFEIKVYDALRKNPKTLKGKIPDGHFKSIEELIVNINVELTKSITEWKAAFKIHQRKDGRLEFNLITRDSSFLNTYHEAELSFHKNVMDMLGFDMTTLQIFFPKNENTPNLPNSIYVLDTDDGLAKKRPDINAGQYFICVHSDIINSTLLNDSKSTLLSVASTSGEFGKHITIEPQQLDFVPLQSTRLQRIEIAVKTSTGDIVNFNRGVVILTLHLRKLKRYD